MNPSISRNRRAKAAQARESGNGEHSQSHHDTNVGNIERQWSMIGGSALAICGLMRGTFSGMALAAIGGALVWRGYSGHCEMYHLLGYSSTEESSSGSKQDQGNESGHRVENQNLHGQESHAGG
jgi:hypothetical protein